MAVIESKRSVPPVQLATREKHSATNPQHSTPKHRSPQKAKKRERLPASLRYTETKRGKTTIRRYDGRTFYRFEEVKGKTVDLIEVFVCADYNCVDVRFDDKTSLTFAIEPAFTLETEHADWKTSDWRLIKKWPLIHSKSHRVKG
jgi:hypothetical protein